MTQRCASAPENHGDPHDLPSVSPGKGRRRPGDEQQHQQRTAGQVGDKVDEIPLKSSGGQRPSSCRTGQRGHALASSMEGAQVALDREWGRFGRRIDETEAWPEPRCPVCSAGRLSFAKPTLIENAASLRLRKPEPPWRWDASDHVHGVFSSTATCSSQTCGQEVVVAGRYGVDFVHEDGDYERARRGEVFHVEYMNPPPLLIALPETAPSTVVEMVRRATKVLFLDPGLAATALRTAVETFLTSEGVGNRDANQNFVPLNTRVKTWERRTNKSDIAALFAAVKWLGNDGTHEDGHLKVKDVIEGAEFIDEAFHRLYHGEDIDARAAAIIAKHQKTRPTG